MLIHVKKIKKQCRRLNSVTSTLYLSDRLLIWIQQSDVNGNLYGLFCFYVINYVSCRARSLLLWYRFLSPLSGLLLPYSLAHEVPWPTDKLHINVHSCWFTTHYFRILANSIWKFLMKKGKCLRQNNLMLSISTIGVYWNVIV